MRWSTSIRSTPRASSSISSRIPAPKAIIVLENFAHTVQQVIAKTAVKHVIVASMGDLLGFKGAIVNFVVRRVKKMVPAWSLPGAVAFNDALAAGRGMTLQQAEARARRRRLPAIHRRHHRRVQGRDAASSQHRRQRAAERRLAAAGADEAAACRSVIIVCALPLYHIFALTACCLLGMRVGGVQLLIPNPRDIAGLRQGAGEVPVQQLPGRQHALQRAAQHPDFAKLDFSKLKVSIGGGMAVQKPVAEQWLKATGCRIVEGYGLSETSPTLTCNPRRHRPNTPARSACRCRRPRSRSATTTATKCRSASRARSAPRARR